MITLKQAFFAESSVTKVAGLFDSSAGAASAARRLLGDSNLVASQVKVLGPVDAQSSRDAVLGDALEPEQDGIWRTLIRAHLTTGAVGLLAGASVFAALMATGNGAVRDSPDYAFVLLCAFGLVFGLVLGGVISLRPDHARVISIVRTALQKGNWAVIAHPVDATQTHDARACLQGGSLRVVRSW